MSGSPAVTRAHVYMLSAGPPRWVPWLAAGLLALGGLLVARDMIRKRAGAHQDRAPARLASVVAEHDKFIHEGGPLTERVAALTAEVVELQAHTAALEDALDARGEAVRRVFSELGRPVPEPFRGREAPTLTVIRGA